MTTRDGPKRQESAAWEGKPAFWKATVGCRPLTYEWNHRYFRPIDRYRPIEYDRDWSYAPVFQSAEEPFPVADHIAEASLGMQKNADNRWNYQAGYRQRGEAIDGWQHKAVLRRQIGKAILGSDYFRLASMQGTNRSSWERAEITAAYRLGSWLPGYTYQVDRNAITHLPTDSVVSTAMNYGEHLIFLQVGDTGRAAATFRIDANRRIDSRPVDGRLLPSHVSHTANASFSAPWRERNLLTGTLTYRRLSGLQLADTATEETVQGRLALQNTWWKNSFRSDLSFALLNGRELRREYVFVQVIPGQGTHTWRDDNGDGVQDLSEFYEAINPDERTFAKIFVPTDHYISAYQTILNYSLEIDHPGCLAGRGGFSPAPVSFFCLFGTAARSQNAGKRLGLQAQCME